MHWVELNWNELSWTELSLIELNWIELSWIELKWTELNWVELSWSEVNWIELNWFELTWNEWIGLNWLGLNETLTRIDSNWVEFNWVEMNCIELSWIELSQYELNLFELTWIDLDWVEFELNWLELSWVELNWTELNWMNQFWKESCAKASFPHLQLSPFDGSIARKLRSHIFNFLHFEGSIARKLHFRIFNFHIMGEVSHDSFVFTSSTFRFWRKSRTKAWFSHFQPPLFEGSLARKLRFHIFNNHILREVSHEMRFWKLAVRTKCCVLQDKTCPGRWMAKLVRRAVAEHARLGADHGPIGPAVALTVQVGFAARSCVVFCNPLRQGCLARRLRA